ncbi:cation diffusion facilitator family transporter [Saccharicrinis sp. FJH2]|uniref:cation diffusion facilitator family transporter n=1 Tax=unclassified Saccharicrinis TaxID=2646859 RepID=UPI0035D4D551
MTPEKLNQREGWVSVFGNIILFGIKLWAGIVSSSAALIADAWHTLSDSFSSILVLFGAKLSEKPADKEHPFGHGRAELVIALLIGALLAAVAWEFFMEGISRFKNREAANFGIVAIIVTIISIISKEGMAQYAFRIFKKTESRSVKADGWHHRSDAFSSLVVLAGIFLGKHFWWADAVLSIAVALLILYAAIEIINDSANRILGDEPDNRTLKILKSICDRYIESDTVHHIHIHKYGRHSEITFHIRMNPEMTLHQAHDITLKIEKDVRKEMNMEATIHPEPCKANGQD